MTSLTRREFLRTSSAAVLGAPMLFGSRYPSGRVQARADPLADLDIMPRTAWATDRPPLGPLPPEDVRFLLVHHTVTHNDYVEDDVPRFLRGFYDHHTSDRKGWNDIAYNFIIDRFGQIWEARAGSLAGPVAGDATGGNQGFTQLCAIIGDFTEVMPSDESLDSLSLLLAALAIRYQIDTTPDATITFTSRGSNRWPVGDAVATATVAGHRDMSKTACPGDTFYPYVQEHLPERVHRVRQTVTPPTTTTTTTTATTTTTLPPAAVAAAPDTTAPAASGSLSDPDIPLGTGLVGLAAAAAVS